MYNCCQLSQTVSPGSNGQTEVHFELSRQRISAADIEQIWPGINVTGQIFETPQAQALHPKHIEHRLLRSYIFLVCSVRLTILFFIFYIHLIRTCVEGTALSGPDISSSKVHFDEGTGTVTSQSLSDYTAQLLSEPSPFGGQTFGCNLMNGRYILLLILMRAYCSVDSVCSLTSISSAFMGYVDEPF